MRIRWSIVCSINDMVLLARPRSASSSLLTWLEASNYYITGYAVRLYAWCLNGAERCLIYILLMYSVLYCVYTIYTCYRVNRACHTISSTYVGLGLCKWSPIVVVPAYTLVEIFDRLRGILL